MKTAVKYILHDLKKVILVFFLIYAIFVISGSALISTVSFSGNTVYFNGTGFSIMLVNFILGLVMFKEFFWMFTQNGISRKTYFKSCLISFIILDVTMTVLALVLPALLQPLGFISEDLISVFLTAFYPDLSENMILKIVLAFLFTLLIFYLSFIAGYFVAALFYRAGKFGKILIAAGLPVTIFVILPVSYNFIAPFWDRLAEILLALLGKNSGSPLFALLSLCAGSLLLILCSYPLLRKAEIS